MSNAKVSVITGLLDAAEDHLHQVDMGRVQLARSAQRIASELRTWESALKSIDANQEYALEAIAEARRLRPHIRGAVRNDLANAA
jgi:hypothetical protein